MIEVNGNILYQRVDDLDIESERIGQLSNNLNYIIGSDWEYQPITQRDVANSPFVKTDDFAFPNQAALDSIGSAYFGLNNSLIEAGFWQGFGSTAYYGPFFSYTHDVSTSHFPAVVCPGYENESSYVTQAQAINDDGVVAGSLSGQTETRVFVATPVGNPSLSLSSDSWDFGSHQAPTNAGTEKFQATIYISNSGTAPLNIPNLYSNPANPATSTPSYVIYPFAGFDSTVNNPQTDNFGMIKTSCGQPVAASDFCSVTLQWVPDWTKPGKQEQTFLLADNAPDGPHTIVVRGTVTAKQLQFSTTTATFPSVAVGQQADSASIFVYTQGGAPVTFSSISLTGADPQDFSITKNTCGGTQPGYHTCSVGVAFKPTATKARTALMTFVDDAVNGAQQVILNGSGKGTR